MQERPPTENDFASLVDLVARLRGPGGCPWDREQTHESLKPNAIEEAYEVVEAIDDRDDGHLQAELGDLLLQVVFHAQIATEGRRFAIADVIARLCEKLVRRHPHVFGDHRADTPGEVLRSWEATKAAEQKSRGKGGGSMLDSVSNRIPAVMEAFQMTTKVSRVGFDWPDASSGLDKLDEEVEELKQAAAKQPLDHAETADEVGDLLFVAVNVARLLGIDPESALKRANRKFRRRFRHVEEGLAAQGRGPADSTLAEMDALWDEAKRLERSGA